MLKINNNWEYTENWSTDFMKDFIGAESVRLPHNVGTLPLHYADPENYSTVCGYRRVIHLRDEDIGKKIFLQFDGAAHVADVFVNYIEVATHRCGYTSFRVDITDYVMAGENSICVRLDTSENSFIPPFGGAIDYLTYGGLYRDVWLDVRPKTYIEDVFVTTPNDSTVHVETTCSRPPYLVDVEIYGADGSLIANGKDVGVNADINIPNPHLWSPETPYLYTCVVRTGSEDGPDSFECRFGIRSTKFAADGFYLNGKKYFIRGLNRHQSFPYIGYAAPEHLQREDARILKEELCVNAVRTSHYPQSRYFLDECDRLGLLVFTEIPGWQHIGDHEWKEQCLENEYEMIMECRNHPSVILWGVRVNESADDDEFYRQANELAHKMDPSRATTGTRFFEKSHLLEDVYSYNDFSYDGTGAGCKPKSAVMNENNKALLITEANGHMFPTKACDSWEKRQEHALRHATVLNAAMSTGLHAGCFQWCMSDYATHEDFGSGDRVCYHGVLDQFRNHKLAAALYASQGDDEPVLEIGSSFNIGDYPGGNLGSVYAFTNADEVQLYKNDEFVRSFSALDSKWGKLNHGPVEINDTLGTLLRTQEGFDDGKAQLVKECLTAVQQYGLSKLPFRYKLKLFRCKLAYHLTLEDGVALYNKYISNWGSESTRWRFDAVKDGVIVKSVTCSPGKTLHLDVNPGKTTLVEGETYDMCAVRIRVLDENNNVANYAQTPIACEAEGAIEVVGPTVSVAEGGMCGTYVKTIGQLGEGRLTVYTESGMSEVIEFEVVLQKGLSL